MTFARTSSNWISEFTRDVELVDGAMLAASLGRRSEGIDGICNVPKVAGRTWSRFDTQSEKRGEGHGTVTDCGNCH